jgi:peptide/nickel transport system substrate-binding protein
MSNDRNELIIRNLTAHRVNRRRLVGGAAAAALAAPLAGLEAPGHAGAVAAHAVRSQTDPKTLVVTDFISGGNWLYFDPGKFYEINPSAGLQIIYETLYHIPDGNEIGAIEPLLADDFPAISDDGLTATIKLRSGVQFSTGNEMTADDWVWSLNRLKNLIGNPSFLVTDFMESYRAVDPTTLEIKLLSPLGGLNAILTSIMLSVMDSKAAQENGGVAEEGADQTDKLTDWLNAGNSIGTGPFRLTQWDVNGEIILEKNDGYWGDAPALDRIIFRNVADSSTRLQLLETGEADMTFALDPDQIPQVEGNDALQILEGPSLAYQYLALNTSEDVGGPLAVKEARQALANAIDYDGIISGLIGGRGVRPATVVPLGLLGADEVQDLAYQTDLDKANELWAASGNGPTEITLTFGAGFPAPGGLVSDILGAKLQEDLQRIDGLTVKLNPVDNNVRLTDYRAGKLQFNMSDWSPDYADVHAYAYPFAATDGGAAKRVFYVNPDNDPLLDAGVKEQDVAKRTEDYVQVQKNVIDDTPFIAVYQPNYVVPAASSVQGAAPHAIYIIQLRYASKGEPSA